VTTEHLIHRVFILKIIQKRLNSLNKQDSMDLCTFVWLTSEGLQEVQWAEIQWEQSDGPNTAREHHHEMPPATCTWQTQNVMVIFTAGRFLPRFKPHGSSNHGLNRSKSLIKSQPKIRNRFLQVSAT